jgi:formylglycine-generating enzyme required for sulfatase activity
VWEFRGDGSLVFERYGKKAFGRWSRHGDRIVAQTTSDDPRLGIQKWFTIASQGRGYMDVVMEGTRSYTWRRLEALGLDAGGTVGPDEARPTGPSSLEVGRQAVEPREDRITAEDAKHLSVQHALKGSGNGNLPTVIADPPARTHVKGKSVRPASPAAVSTNPTDMNLILIPPGNFFLGAFKVTQDEYLRVTGINPSHFRGSGRLPVETVTWSDAISFCNRLSKREGLRPYYDSSGGETVILGGDGYRLPTADEWEHACRAGSAARYHFGNNPVDFGKFDWCYDNSGYRTHPVGQKKPNLWGLYDIHGNVWEWCWDREGSDHVLRGGSFIMTANNISASDRDRHDNTWRYMTAGFRVARSAR